MIEESSAASRSLSDEAAKMSQVLKVFKLTEADHAEHPAPEQKRPFFLFAKATPAKPKVAPEKPVQPVTDATKTKEWDDDAAKDAETKRTARARASTPAKPAEKPRAKPEKVAVNQSAPVEDVSSESWEDF